MRNFCIVSTLAVAAVPPVLAADREQPQPSAERTPAAPADLEEGKTIYGPTGGPIGAIYRLTPAGDPQIIRDRRFLTIPAATIARIGNRLVTSLAGRIR